MDLPEFSAATVSPLDPGLQALVMIAYFHGIPSDPAQIKHQAGLSEHFSEADLRLAAKSLGLKTRAVCLRPNRLIHTPLPALMLDQAGQHFILARVAEDGQALIQEGSGGPTVTSVDAVMERSSGRALLFTSRASLAGELARFDFSWFIPAVVKYRSFILEVLLVSLVLQGVALVSPDV